MLSPCCVLPVMGVCISRAGRAKMRADCHLFCASKALLP